MCTYHADPLAHGGGRQVLPELGAYRAAVTVGTSHLTPDDAQTARFVVARAGSLPVTHKQ